MQPKNKQNNEIINKSLKKKKVRNYQVALQGTSGHGSRRLDIMGEVTGIPVLGLSDLMQRKLNPFAQSLNRNWDA